MRTEYRYAFWGHAWRAAVGIAIVVAVFRFVILFYQKYSIFKFPEFSEESGLNIWIFIIAEFGLFFMLAFFSIGVIIGVKRLFYRGVILRINDMGIYYKPDFLMIILWSEIEDYDFEVLGDRAWAKLEVRDAERFIKPSWRYWPFSLSRTGAAKRGKVNVYFSSLDADKDQIMDVFEHYWEKSRQAE